MSSIMGWRSGLMGLSDIAKAPVSHGVEPHDLETGSSLRSRRHPFRTSCRPSPRLPRERFSPYVDTGRGWPEAKQVAEPMRLSQHTPSEVLLRSAATRESAVHFHGDAHNPAFDLSGGCPPGLDRALAMARSSSQLIFGNLLWRVPIVAIYRAKTRAERRGSSPSRHRWSIGSETHEIPSLARPCRRPPH